MRELEQAAAGVIRALLAEGGAPTQGLLRQGLGRRERRGEEGRREGGDRGHAARAAAPRVPATMPHFPRRLEPKRLALALKKVSFHTSILQLQSGAAAANART
jgi:hypothetical protein